jgi:hypothetical protein
MSYMTTGIAKYYVFLLLTCLLSIPFYIGGAISPVSGLPFGLPISFLMIFVLPPEKRTPRLGDNLGVFKCHGTSVL